MLVANRYETFRWRREREREHSGIELITTIALALRQDKYFDALSVEYDRTHVERMREVHVIGQKPIAIREIHRVLLGGVQRTGYRGEGSPPSRLGRRRCRQRR